jgi:hypothetical protein
MDELVKVRIRKSVKESSSLQSLRRSVWTALFTFEREGNFALNTVFERWSAGAHGCCLLVRVFTNSLQQPGSSSNPANIVNHGVHVPEDLHSGRRGHHTLCIPVKLTLLVLPVAFERGIWRSNVACVWTLNVVRTWALVCKVWLQHFISAVWSKGRTFERGVHRSNGPAVHQLFLFVPQNAAFTLKCCICYPRPFFSF